MWIINSDCFHNNDSSFDTDIDSVTDTDTFYETVLSASGSWLRFNNYNTSAPASVSSALVI